MGTFNCCRGHVKNMVPCNTQAQTNPPAADAQIEKGMPVPVHKPEGFFKRAARFIKPVLPAFLLAIVPKCPFCLAAYVALGTGIGLSVTSARFLHVFLLCAGIIPLSLYAANHIGAYFFPAPFMGRRPLQQAFTGMIGILIGSGILLLF